MNFLSNITRSEGDPRILRTGPSSLSMTDKLARGLGWFSIGLGLVELVAPRKLTRALGMEGMEPLVRAYGARELAAGVVTLSPDKQVGLTSRVVGDALDIATLLAAMGPRNRRRDNVGLALAMVVGVTMLDIAATKAVAVRHGRKSNGDARRYADRTGFPQGVEAARRVATAQRQGA
ncbi:hypothetical protein SLNSH_01330 [Alsobacter soli]|uniref:Cyclase dehydrase n=1 Tax=Alsobacter soli TaxID=2109933 RepID=A0A2T1HZB7_9HYPH|nr:hypothetical protein [Alsobacter soli]PSC07046.1 hypothetical protein SLNSH_01330 [Alsobacter soli]